jgi:regulation of enolase protein 1 (concanavalin A-like superfamily)
MIVSGGGQDIWGSSDQFRFAYHQLSGDVDISVRVADLDAVDGWTKAGLMIRDSMTDTSRNAFLFLSGGNGLGFQWRATPSGASDYVPGPLSSAPVWMRLIRHGNDFFAYQSTDGTTWIALGVVTLDMPNTAYVGFAVTSRDPARSAAATFANLSDSSSPLPLPSSLTPPWISSDVGGPALAGTATENGGTFSVAGGGVDIWDTSDQFQFVYQPITGDTQIVAYVASLQAADVWSKAGVMIRGALTGPAPNASMFASGGGGWEFQRRLWPGYSTYYNPGGGGGAPGWIRLVREGSLFSAYESHDGSQWTLVGTDTIAMPATVYVGLAVSSHNPGALATATFSNVTIGTPTSSNKPPTVALSAPASGTIYTAPANIVISATAGDVDGAVVRVDFYTGTQLVGSATASPFTTTWSSVPAGTYSLAAIATDNGGASTTSQPIAVVVAPATSSTPTSTLIFVPPADYASNVTSMTVELRRAVDGVTVTTRDLGKPSVVGGQISSDISTLVDPLPAGSYYAVMVSTGPGGSTPSGPSPVFSK